MYAPPTGLHSIRTCDTKARRFECAIPVLSSTLMGSRALEAFHQPNPLLSQATGAALHSATRPHTRVPECTSDLHPPPTPTPTPTSTSTFTPTPAQPHPHAHLHTRRRGHRDGQKFHTMAMSHVHSAAKACNVSIGNLGSYSLGFNQNVSSICKARTLLHKLSSSKEDVHSIQ